jgi:hypothetical protein
VYGKTASCISIPEVVSGMPFSNNLVGLGGFTNGEITRAAGSDLKLYRQRLFLRQTWNQGGGSEKIESDFNQMAGTVDKNRVVVTAGNFSTLDVFDDNKYAKDPRTQFMNWAIGRMHLLTMQQMHVDMDGVLQWSGTSMIGCSSWAV